MAKPTVNIFKRSTSTDHHLRVDGKYGVDRDYEFTISMNELTAEGMQTPLRQGSSTYKTTWKKTATREIPVIVKMLTRLNITEAERLFNARHKNIVTFYGAIIEPPVYGIVIELCNGVSLFDHLRQNPRPDLELALKLAKGIGLGLRYLHEDAIDAPIKHAQLTSAKVMLHNKGETIIPKIGGFGYSRKNKGTQMTDTYGRMQCFQWMAPELIKGEKSQTYCDIYSFGIILWELLSGEVPHKGKMMFQAMQDITDGKHLTIPDGCPSDLEELMLECWSMTPTDRPALRTILERLEFGSHLVYGADYQPDEQVNDPSPEPTDELDGNLSYDNVALVEQIGKGRMGTTHRAKYQGRPIVIKSLFRALVTRENFESYMRDVCDIRHNNIIRLLGGFVDERVIMMESMDNSLRGKLQTGPITDKRVFKHIARDVACGLNHLHSMKPSHMVHGSLTSSNILVDESNNAKITDIYYMRLDKASSADDSIYVDVNCSRMSTDRDVFSFGIVLIEMRAGEMPSKSSNQTFKHVHDTWPTLYLLAKRCVSTHHRPNMKEVIEALDELA